MARRLIEIPRPASRIEGAEEIGGHYPRDYAPEDMRRWAGDVVRLRATPPEEVERLRALGSERLSPEERGVVDAYDNLFTEPSRGIKGSLRDDGVVELAGGRHRAAYIMERNDPVPVWVSCPDERRLDDYAARCERELARDRAADRSREDSGRGGDRVRA